VLGFSIAWNPGVFLLPGGVGLCAIAGRQCAEGNRHCAVAASLDTMAFSTHDLSD